MDKNFAIFGKPVKHPVWEQTKELITIIIFGCAAFLYLSIYLYELTLVHHMEWAFTAVMVIAVPVFIAVAVAFIWMLADICIRRH